MLLLALFIGVPLIEIALFVQLGSVLDIWWILLTVVVTAVLGAWLVRRQGRNVLEQIQTSIHTLNDPTEPLAHGAMILFSGALLLTPGFFTDTIGFLLLVPAFRVLAFRWLKSRVVAQSFTASTMSSGPRPGTDGPRAAGRQDGVIDGDYRDVTGETPPNPSTPRPPSGWTQD